MATASKVKLDTSLRPVFAVEKLREDTASVVSDLLQQNHDEHHIFFNDDGFHNHIVHHLLTLYAIGATPTQIKRQYKVNQSYQRPLNTPNHMVLQDMHDTAKFKKYLGKQKYYSDYLAYFKEEIEAKGWEKVLMEYVFAGDERANDMLVRMFGGFLHPIIHLGFGVEFRQPAIIAEALAQAAVHANTMGPFLLGTEELAGSQNGASRPKKSLVQLLEELRANEAIVKSPSEDDNNKLYDGVMGRAKDEIVKLTAQYVVEPGDLDERLAEMVNFVAYFTLSSQRPPHRPKLDFFYIHSLNTSIFLPSFLSPSSPLPISQRTRLLEWKSRTDLAMYASRGSPALLPSDIDNYARGNTKRQGAGAGGWTELFARVSEKDDDGHAAKVLRALAHGEQICGDGTGVKNGSSNGNGNANANGNGNTNDNVSENNNGEKGLAKRDWAIQPHHWLPGAQMALDSVLDVGGGSPEWIRNCGFESAWEGVGFRES